MKKRRSLEEQRQIAIGAVRSEMRRKGIPLKGMSAETAWAVLDELCRTEPTLVASQWYLKASEQQFKLFKKEWNEWQALLERIAVR